ncbi:hypothetical protein E3Q09_02524 [Wallemia mellicola]|nr:hypothetical protein E3Q09_02524 [Wallemia mellicola]TIC49395.1 hypothetical protein E3Q04_04356 [Wallemia mellicola]
MKSFDYKPQTIKRIIHDTNGNIYEHRIMNAIWREETKSIDLYVVIRGVGGTSIARMFDRRYLAARETPWDSIVEKEFRSALVDGDLSGQEVELRAHRECLKQYERQKNIYEFVKQEHLYYFQEYETSITLIMSNAPGGHYQEYFNVKGILLQHVIEAKSLPRSLTLTSASHVRKTAVKVFNNLARSGILLQDYDLNELFVFLEFDLEFVFMDVDQLRFRSEFKDDDDWANNVIAWRRHFNKAVAAAVDDQLTEADLFLEPQFIFTDNLEGVFGGFTRETFMRFSRKNWEKCKEIWRHIISFH